MPSDPIEDARQNARLMGTLYGLIIGMEATGQPITYNAIKQGMAQYCTPQKLNLVIAEAKRYSDILQEAINH